MVWGHIAGALIGGVLSNNAANKEAKAMDKATEANMAGFNMAKPYLNEMYGGASNAYKDYLAAGAYSGDTLAQPNAYATNAYNTMGGYSPALMSNAYNMANNNAGFSNNYQDLYNNAIGGGQLKNAQDYANANSQPLVDSALRDTRRTLEEDTLTGINRGASASGNANSSRAGIADSRAIEAYNDRAADVDIAIKDQLMNRYLTQNNINTNNAFNATSGMGNAYNTGMGALGTAGDYGTTAGNALMNYENMALADAKNKYNDNLNFGFNALNNYNSVLGGAPTSVSGIRPNLVDPMSATLGGAMSGAGVGGKFSNYLGGMPFAQPSKDMGNINPFAKIFGNV